MNSKAVQASVIRLTPIAVYFQFYVTEAVTNIIEYKLLDRFPAFFKPEISSLSCEHFNKKLPFDAPRCYVASCVISHGAFN